MWWRICGLIPVGRVPLCTSGNGTRDPASTRRLRAHDGSAMIRVDSTAFSTVVVCSRCAGWYWAGLGGEQLKARQVAAAHEVSCHPDQHDARKAYENAHGHTLRKFSDKKSGVSGRRLTHGSSGDASRHRVGDAGRGSDGLPDDVDP